MTIVGMLGEWVVRSTVFAAVAGALLWFLRVKNVSLRLAAWTAVLAGAILMPALVFVTPRISIAVPKPASREAAARPALGGPVRPQFIFPVAGGQLNSAPVWPTLLAGAWALVSSAMLLRLFAGLYFTRRLVRGGREVQPGVLESAAIAVPVTVGLWRSLILLPRDWREWDQSKLNAVLAHERAHVLGHDPLRKFAASVYRAVCWFHPLAWWLAAKLADLAEAVSDDAALAVVTDEGTYAETLLGFWGRTPRRVLWEGVAMARSGKLSRRMERILDSHRTPAVSLARGAWVALVLTAGAAVYLASSAQPVWADAQAPAPPAVRPLKLAAPIERKAVPPVRLAQARPAQAAPAPVRANPYAAWLNEDVVYIIEPAERLAFLALQSDAERKYFIGQFWQRRDTGLMPEHYRRIAYANAHFASVIPGWKTDRGRIYITFGPADEIESHPARSAAGEPPFEVWRYHHIERVGDNITWKFVDKAGTGEYTIEPAGSSK